MNIKNIIEKTGDITKEDIKKMTQDFDIISFYNNCQDSLAVIMITQHQVIVIYWNISDENHLHKNTIDMLLNLLKNIGEKSIITLSLATENIYDIYSEEEKIVDVNKFFSSEISADEDGITSKMIEVVRMMLKKISDLDVEHDPIEDLTRQPYNKTELINNEDIEIIGIPIDDYLLKLEEKGQEDHIKSEGPEL